MAEEKTEKAGVVALIFSFLFPLIGIICYFVNKKEVENASAYLWAALGGFVMGIILRLAAA
jgi:membrane associated rhomboid family serine protease